jgi:hypothetical protein
VNLERRRLGQSLSGPAPTREQQLEQMLREYYDMLEEYEKIYFFRQPVEQRARLQQRAKALLERGNS